MHKFSTILYTSGFSFLVIGLAPESQNMISFCKKNDTIHRIPRPIRTKGKKLKVIFNHSFQEPVFVKNQVITTQNTRNKNAGNKTNNKIVFL
jgi:hypothetical protein